jgi:DNA-binding CsgD family transcriptional regulator
MDAAEFRASLNRIRDEVAALERGLASVLGPRRPSGAGRRAQWDTTRGRRLWNEGVTLTRIGRAVGVNPKAVQAYARRNGWPARGRGWRPGEPPGGGRDWSQARRLWESGLSLRAVAAQLGWSENTVKSARQRQQWTRTTERPRPLTWDPVAAQRLWEEDELSAEEIARRVGIKRPTLLRYARAHDWPRRGKGWQPKTTPIRPPRVPRRSLPRQIPLTRCPNCEAITTRDPCECCRQVVPIGMVGKMDG